MEGIEEMVLEKNEKSEMTEWSENEELNERKGCVGLKGKPVPKSAFIEEKKIPDLEKTGIAGDQRHEEVQFLELDDVVEKQF